MKRFSCLLFLVCFLCFLSLPVFAEKISDLPAATSLSDDDLFVIVDDPGGTPVTKNVTRANTGLVVGPSSSTTNYSICFDGTTGKLLKECSAQPGTVSTYNVGTLTNTYLCTYTTASGFVCNTNPATFQLDLGLVAGTLTNTYLCTYTTSGTLLSCNTDPASFAIAAHNHTGTYLPYLDPTGKGLYLLRANAGGTANEYANSISGLTIGGFTASKTIESDGDGNLIASAATYTKTIASGANALDFDSTATGACATLISVAATGVASTDVVIFTPNASIKAVTGYVPASTGGFTITAYPTSGYVNFEGCNWTAGTVDPGSITVNWMVTR